MHGFASQEEARRRLSEYEGMFELSTDEDGILPIEQWPLSRILRGEVLRGWEVRIRRCGSDVRRVFSYGGTVAKDADGTPLLAVVTVADITERKRAEQEIRQLNAELEQRVRERTAQLEAANQELEAFAYSVSHDLRAPLRGIDGWSLALVEDYGGQLDGRACQYLNRVRSETQRMGALIDDLLQLSRVARAKLERQAVDLTSLAGAIAGRLKEASANREIEFLIMPELAATGDARLLAIALTNLLDNAAKFTGPRAKACVEVGQMRQNGERPFYVRDNGVGFNMTYAGTLFAAFQRLHKPSEFPGTGIGLATVQRVIARHGGRVWAEAKPDQGATFYFTIPAAE
jgi:light-regulated signal transduction histidine kinase (bacteriophytochrome)